MYWTNVTNDTIGRAPINDPTNVQGAWLSSAQGVDNPNDIAVFQGRIYWANQGSDSIGRADITPTGDPPANIDPGFVEGPRG